MMPHETRNALLIYNPASGRRRKRRFGEVEQAARILKQAGIAVELAPTTGRATATLMAHEAIEQKRDLVIACGGDGTINEIVNGLVGSRVPLALLPAGTANILAKELGIPWDIPAAAHLIADGVERRVALGMATPLPVPGQALSEQVRRYFLCVAGAGPDGAIVQMIGEAAKTRAGIFAYWWEGLRQLMQYRFPEMRVAGGGHDMRATLVVIGRTVNYGGPFKITIGASLFEDSFEVLVHTSRSRWRYLICLPALWTGQLRKMDCIHAWKTTEVTCWPAKSVDVFAQVDGEPAGVLPIHFRIVPDALTLIVPKALRT